MKVTRWLCLLALALLGGCAWGEIRGVEMPDPNEPVLKVTAVAKGLSHVPDKCHVVCRYGGFQAVANVPIFGASDPETCEVILERWERLSPPASPAALEIWFTYPSPRHPIDRQRFAVPEGLTPALVESALAGGRRNTPRTAQRPRERERTAPSGPRPPRGWGSQADLSADLDTPSERDLSDPIVVFLEAKQGARYFKVAQPPVGLVQLVIDVKSNADPSSVNEATWFRVSLLDEAGMALPHEEQEFVGVGQSKRHVATWRFDGSPVIFKLATGSKRGDWMRIRFQEQ